MATFYFPITFESENVLMERKWNVQLCRLRLHLWPIQCPYDSIYRHTVSICFNSWNSPCPLHSFGWMAHSLFCAFHFASKQGRTTSNSRSHPQLCPFSLHFECITSSSNRAHYIKRHTRLKTNFVSRLLTRRRVKLTDSWAVGYSLVCRG
jgi:hypothetical protein